jgi:hypothetical protein
MRVHPAQDHGVRRMSTAQLLDVRRLPGVDAVEKAGEEDFGRRIVVGVVHELGSRQCGSSCTIRLPALG